MTEYTDGQIEDMRAQLAKTWRQSKSQVTDCEARFYLDLERELLTSMKNAAPRVTEAEATHQESSLPGGPVVAAPPE
jgi:hypothetical protein